MSTKNGKKYLDKNGLSYFKQRLVDEINSNQPWEFGEGDKENAQLSYYGHAVGVASVSEGVAANYKTCEDDIVLIYAIKKLNSEELNAVHSSIDEFAGYTDIYAVKLQTIDGENPYYVTKKTYHKDFCSYTVTDDGAFNIYNATNVIDSIKIDNAFDESVQNIFMSQSDFSNSFDSQHFGASEMNNEYALIVLETTPSITENSNYCIGIMTGSFGDASHSEGYNTTSNGDYSHSEGNQTAAFGKASHAEGSGTIGMGDYSHAEGSKTTASGNYSHAEGNCVEAVGVASHAEGWHNIDSTNSAMYTVHQDATDKTKYYIVSDFQGPNGGGDGIFYLTYGMTFLYNDEYYCVTEVFYSDDSNTKPYAFRLNKSINKTDTNYFYIKLVLGKSIGEGSHTEGCNTVAYKNYSHAEGNTTRAAGANSHAEGAETASIGSNSHAEGFGGVAIGDGSHVEGGETKTIGNYSHAEGVKTSAEGFASHSEGIETYANGRCSHTEGSGTIGIGEASHAEGSYSQANGANSHAEGSYTQANGQYSHAEGHITTAYGSYSHTEGIGTEAHGIASHTEGSGTIGIGEASHAEGSGTQANGNYSHAEGSGSIGIGKYSHVEGLESMAIGSASHAEGIKSKSEGSGAHAEGYRTHAEGYYSHAEGNNTVAYGSYSHAEGNNTITTNEAEHAEGQFNKSNVRTRSSIGIGSSETDRKNAFEVMQNGDTYLIGVGYYDGTNATSSDSKTIQDTINGLLTTGGSMGSIIYNGSTYEDYLVDGGYVDGMRVNDVILDNGGILSDRRGNIYRITEIDENYDGSGNGAGTEYIQTNFSDIQETDTFIIIGRLESEDKYFILSKDTSNGENEYQLAIECDNIEITADGKLRCKSVDENTAFLHIKRNPVYNELTMDGTRILLNGSGKYENDPSDDYALCVYSKSNCKFANVTNSSNSTFEFDGQNKNLIGKNYKYSTTDKTLTENYNKTLVIYKDTNDVYTYRFYAQSNVREKKIETFFLTEKTFEVINPSTPYVKIDTEPISNILGPKGDGVILEPGNNISIEDNKISALGYTYNGTLNSFAEGKSAIANGNYSHAEGEASLSKGTASHAEGSGTLSNGNYSHAEGINTIAYGVYSHAEGTGNNGVQEAYTYTIKKDGDDYKIIQPFHIAEASGSKHLYIHSGNCLRYTSNNGNNFYYAISEITEDNSSLPIEDTGKTYTIKFKGTGPKGLTFPEDGTGLVFYLAFGIAYGTHSHSEGKNTTASGDCSHAEGNSTESFGNNSHVEGSESYSLGESSHAEGKNTIAIGTASHAECYSTVANGNNSHAEGRDTYTEGTASHAEGFFTTARGNYSHTEGRGTEAHGEGSHAEGVSTYTTAHASHAEGYNTQAMTKYSHAEGYCTKTGHTEGKKYTTQLNISDTIDAGTASHVEGAYTIAQGTSSHAEGRNTLAYGVYSHAEGYKTIAAGNYSHVEGLGNRGVIYKVIYKADTKYDYEIIKIYDSDGTEIVDTTQEDYTVQIPTVFAHGKLNESSTINKNSAYYVANNFTPNGSSIIGSTITLNRSIKNDLNETSTGEEYITVVTGVALGTRSHVEGSESIAIGGGSHAEGYRTQTTNGYEHAEGMYNKSNTGTNEGSQTISSIGIGTTTERKNAVEVMANGDMYVKGVGNYDGTNAINSNTEGKIAQSLQECIPYTWDSVNKILYLDGKIYTTNGFYETGNEVDPEDPNDGKLELEIATKSSLGVVQIGNGLDITDAGVLSLHAASNVEIGGVKAGENISITEDGTLTAKGYTWDNDTTTMTVGDETSGEVHAANGFFETSDVRKKNVIDELPLDKAYNLINNCQSIIYTLKDNTDKQQIGLIAQEVQEFFPEVVSTDKDGYLSLDYAKLTVILFRVMKDLIDRVSKLENK